MMMCAPEGTALSVMKCGPKGKAWSWSLEYTMSILYHIYYTCAAARENLYVIGNYNSTAP